MTVSEYEERFRVSAPSLHETFVAMQGRGARRRRSQRFWAAVALAGAIMAANEVALHHSAGDFAHHIEQMSQSLSDQPLYRLQADRRVHPGE